jgi:hypothetical protein
MWTIEFGNNETETLTSATELLDLALDFADSGTVWHMVTGPDIDGMDANDWLNAMTME